MPPSMVFLRCVRRLDLLAGRLRQERPHPFFRSKVGLRTALNAYQAASQRLKSDVSMTLYGTRNDDFTAVSSQKMGCVRP